MPGPAVHARADLDGHGHADQRAAHGGIALQAVAWFAVWPMFGASLVCLATDRVLSPGSKYGLLRY